MMKCALFTIFDLGKQALAKEYWEHLRVKLKFFDGTHRACDYLIEGVWEVSSKGDGRIIHRGIYAMNDIKKDFLLFTERMCKYLLEMELVPPHEPYRA